ncbi:MAG: hypothetical protein IPG59_01850 [Candidatus Melainabacteria bacterium]|nr:MAG: hypothetical protein IPG59_01850 [Candidatus Melainabacteria bacterium]
MIDDIHLPRLSIATLVANSIDQTNTNDDCSSRNNLAGKIIKGLFNTIHPNTSSLHFVMLS